MSPAHPNPGKPRQSGTPANSGRTDFARVYVVIWQGFSPLEPWHAGVTLCRSLSLCHITS